jgi:hypothetical protein
MQSKPAFLITIDTEGDDIWARPKCATTRNAAWIPRFQELCEKYALKPTYLTNYEMANSRQFQEFGRDVIARDVGEIGMHLHAWDTPPSFPLTENDRHYQPYLIEYPERLMREKVKAITGLLEEVFRVKMLSHRAGRWAVNETYAKILVEHDYVVDCSVTPHVSWEGCLGDPSRGGGANYVDFPQRPYFMDLSNISLPGDSKLLEVPVSIGRIWGHSVETLRAAFGGVPPVGKALNRVFPRLAWLRPNGRNLKYMLRLLRNAVHRKQEHVEFMIHSSELMPGGSANFSDERGIDGLYKDLERLFAEAHRHFEGLTLAEFAERAIVGARSKVRS